MSSESDKIARANAINILKKLQRGEILTPAERLEAERFQEEEDAKRVLNRLSPRQLRFVEMVAGGSSQTDAYIEAYGRTGSNRQDAGVRAGRVAKRPAVVAALAHVRKESLAGAILSRNERLRILAGFARRKANTAPMIQAVTRVVEVYDKLAGDAPEQPPSTPPPPVNVNANITVSGDPANPVHVVHHQPTKAEKLAALRAARTREKAGATPAQAPG